MSFKRDATWIRQAFLLPKRAIDAVDAERRTYNTGYRKFTDTSLGGNFALNTPYGFTPFCDLPEPRLHSKISASGMGRWYSECIDDYSIHVHMRFGVAQFSSWTSFFGNFYSAEASRMARTGRGSSLFFTLGKLAGFVVSLPFTPFILAGQAIRFLLNKPSNKYYYLKPTMPLYWNTVTMITNHLAANMGFIAGQGMEQYKDGASGLTGQDIAERNFLLPDTFRKDGGIDIYRIATKAQRLADQQYREIARIQEEAGTLNDLKARMLQWQTKEITPESDGRPLAAYMDDYFRVESSKDVKGKTTELPQEPNAAKGASKPTQVFTDAAESINDYYGKNGKEDSSLVDYLLAEARDGSQFITLRVDDPGEISESFSSSVRESDISSTINGISNSSRSTKFSFANGNISDGVVGQIVGGVMTAVSDFVAGAAEGLSISGLASLLGNAIADIPKHWDSSTANLPRASFTISLRTPYGNDMSRFQDLYVPLAFLLAGTLPLSTGPASYTSPFLCEMYCKGRNQIRLGMIDSLEIRRGVGNLGWTQDDKPLGIDITFSVVDMSTIMHMPITNMFNPLEPLTPGGLSRMFMGDETAFSDYMAVLSSLGLSDQIYASRRFKRNYNRQVLNYSSWFNKAHFANWALGTTPGQIFSIFQRTTDRP